MATTITSADLTITVTESININGQDVNFSSSKVITGIDAYYKRMFRVSTSDFSTVYQNTGESAVSPLLDSEKVKYIRISNMTTSSAVQMYIKITDSDDGTTLLNLEKDMPFIYGSHNSSTGGSISTSGTTPHDDIKKIELKSRTGADHFAEVFVALDL